MWVSMWEGFPESREGATGWEGRRGEATRQVQGQCMLCDRSEFLSSPMSPLLWEALEGFNGGLGSGK